MRIIGLIIAALVASPAYAGVEKVPNCITFEAMVQASPPGLIRAVTGPVTGDKALSLIAQWNALPPLTHFEADAVQFAFFATGQVGVALIAKGCVVDRGIVPREVFENLMKPEQGNI